MKAIIAKYPKSDMHAIHFSVEIPILEIAYEKRWIKPLSCALSRTHDLAEKASAMVEANIGRLQSEILWSEARFYDYLADLATVEGVERIQYSGRYYIEALPGKCFEGVKVCRRIAEIVQHHFYPESTLHVEIRLPAGDLLPDGADQPV